MTNPTTKTSTILADLVELARTKLDFHGDLTLDSRLVEDLELDSIRLLTLAMEVEDHFRIMLDEDDEAGLTTVGDLVDLIAAKLEPTETPADVRNPTD